MALNFELQEHIQLPPRPSGRKSEANQYVSSKLADLVPDENTLFFPLEDGLTIEALARRVSVAVAGYRKSKGGKFATRREPNGVRVWRLAD